MHAGFSRRRLGLLLIAAVACAAPSAPRYPRVGPPVAPDLRAARLALGPIDDVLVPADDPRPRLRALRDLSDRLDNDEEALGASSELVALSRQRLAIARAEGGDVAGAQRELDADVEAGVALAERRRAGWRVLAILAGKPTGERQRAAFLRAALAQTYLDDGDAAAALALARTPAERARLERLGADVEVPLDELVRLGPAMIDRLDARMVAAAGDGDLARAVAAARAVVAVDPLDVDARLLLAYDADRAAGRLAFDADVVRALVGSLQKPQAVAVVEHARRAAPRAGSLAVGAAWVLAGAGLPGDAWARLAPGGDLGRDLDLLRDDLRGLLALEAGDLAAYRSWRQRRAALRSPFVADVELRHRWAEKMPLQGEIADEAVRRAFAAGWPALRRGRGWGLAEQVAADPDAARALRERAVDAVADPHERAALRHCLAAALPRGACDTLRDDLDAIDEGEGFADVVATVERLASVPGLADRWITAAAWAEGDELRRLAAPVRALEGTAPGLTERWAVMAMRVAIARGDVDEARRVEQAYGALLPPFALAAAHLAIADVAAGGDPDAAVAALGRADYRGWPPILIPAADRAPRVAMPADDDEDGEGEEEAPVGDAGALASVLPSSWAPERPDAAAVLTALRRKHPGPATAALDVLAALRAAAAGDAAAVRLPMPAGAPERDLVAAMVGRGRPAEARAALARYLRRRTEAEWPRDAYLAARAAAGDDLAAVELGDADDRRDLALAGRRGDDPWQLVGEAGSYGSGRFGAAGLRLRERRLAAAPPDQIRARAAEALTYARAAGVTTRSQVAWLALVAGDVAAAGGFATGDDGVGEPLGDADPVVRLLGARGRLADDRVRDLWRLLQPRATMAGAAPVDRTAAIGYLLDGDLGAGAAAVACRMLVDDDAADRALAACWDAWRGGAVDGDVAVALTWTVLQVPDEAAAHGIDAAALMEEVERRLAESGEAGIWGNLAVYYSQHGGAAASRVDELADRADRLGRNRGDDEIAVAQMARSIAPTLRAVVAGRLGADRDSLFTLGQYALAAGEVGAARWYVVAAAARAPADEAGLSPAQEEMFVDATELAASDVASGALAPADVGLWYRSFVTDSHLPGEVIAAHPRSALVAFDVVENNQPHPQQPHFLDELQRRFPTHRLAAMQVATRLNALGRAAEAAAAVARARAAHPDSALLATVIVADPVPAQTGWLGSADAFAAALAAVTPAEVAALEPTREVVGAAEVFLPGRRTGVTGRYDLAVGGRVVVAEIANPTRCASSACMDGTVASLDKTWKLRWRRDLAIGGRPGAAALYDAPFGTVLISLAASGGRLFQTVVLIPAERAAALLPVVRLVEDSLRPLDLVVPSDRAEALRAHGDLPDDAVRLAARGGGGAGCGWLPSGLDPSQRAGLLLDLALLEPARLERAAACAEVGIGAAPLAALALVSDDPAAAAFGRKVAAAHAAAVVEAAVILLADGQSQVSLDQLAATSDERPRRGWLELAAALPDAGREHAVDRLLAATAPGERAAGILIAGLLPTAKTRGQLRNEVSLAPAGLAQLAVEALARPLDAADLAALRRRADRAPAKPAAAERRLLTAIASALVSAADPADRERLARLRARLGDVDDGALDRLVLRHAFAAGGGPSGGRTAAPAAGAPIADAELATAPLPRLLDGGRWSYARAPQPAALSAAGLDLLHRVQVGGAAEQYLLRAVVDKVGGSALALLAADGGLDLAQPIECARTAFGTDDFVCAATVRDAAALDRTLGAEPSSLSGIRLPEGAAMFGVAITALAGAGPLFADRALSDSGKDDEASGLSFAGLASAGGRTVLHERARLAASVAGRTLTRHVLVSASDEGASDVSGPAVLVVGRRLLVFGNLAIAARVLTDRPAAGAALADDAGFRAATADWSDGVVVQSYEPDRGDGQYVFEVAPEAGGVRFRMRSRGGTPTLAVGGALGLLPSGSAGTLAVSRLRRDRGDASVGQLLGAWRWLLEVQGDAAYGWYPASGANAAGWVIAARWDRQLARRAADHGLGGLRPGAVRTSGDLHAGRAGDYLIVASRDDLLRAALARRPGRDDLILVSHLDGAALAADLRSRTVAPEKVPLARVLGLAADVFGRIDASGRRDGDVERIEGVIRPSLGAADDRGAVDRWLASPQMRNTLKLPRNLAPAETEAPLAFTMQVADARATAPRLFPSTARIQVAVLDDHHLRVVVAPSPALAAAAPATPLDARGRSRALADDPSLRLAHARLRQVAAQIAPAGTSPAEAARKIGAWVHDHLRYEVTASGGDAVAILERGRGDCTEYSLLAVALLRAAGVPAELRSGIAAGDGELVAHAWVAFHDGTAWREIDPTWGRTSVGADHIETSVLDFVALVSLDKLAVTAVEPATAAASP